jgi:hypothetical protein
MAGGRSWLKVGRPLCIRCERQLGVGAAGQEAGGTGKYGRDQGEADLAARKGRRQKERSGWE